MENMRDIQTETASLERMIFDFARRYGFDEMRIFDDLLIYIIHGFSPEAPPLKSWNYTREQTQWFYNMYCAWVAIMNENIHGKEWFDAFGDIYMSIVSASGRKYNGQFFTPIDICSLMTQIATRDKHKRGRIGDPTCGSGRLLLAYHAISGGNYLVGEDINYSCCMMTVCNFLIHGCVGEVICHNSLLPDSFTAGWYVNPSLNLTGIPTIRTMSREEYMQRFNQENL